MALTEEQFDTLVKRLEKIARQHPDKYKFRVGLLASLGYVYIGLVMIGLLLAAAILIWLVVASGRIDGLVIKLLILLLIPVFIVGRSLFITFPPPEGIELDATKAPGLFSLVRQLTKQLQAPQFHHILLTRNFNAGVVQVPRLGLLGWNRNYLIVGLPLMQALSVNQFKAVLAHELGHLSGNHSRFSGWIYRIRKTWLQILQRLQQSNHSGSAILFEWFFKWYSPFFSAYSFVLNRMNEYEADRCAAELVGAQTAAEALINSEIKACLEHSFWSAFVKQAENEVEPPKVAYTNLLTTLKTDLAEHNSQQWIKQALARKTDNTDTHPCLSDRLAALNYSSNIELSLSKLLPSTTAAEALLGSKWLKHYTTQFDQLWAREVATSWRQEHAYLKQSQQQLKALDEKAKTQTLTPTEEWERICYIYEHQGSEVALPLIQAFLTNQPDHAGANYTLGQLLLKQGNTTGIAYLERAMAKDYQVVIPGCEILYSFFKQQGQLKEAQRYGDRLDRHHQLLARAHQERVLITEHDAFKPHDLSSELVDSLRQQVSSLPKLKEAYLVQKVVTHFPQKPLYVIGVTPKSALIESVEARTKFLDACAEQIKVSDNNFMIVLTLGTMKAVMKRVPNSCIYTSEKK